MYITEVGSGAIEGLPSIGIGFAETGPRVTGTPRSELERAHIVEPTTVPQDVVSSHSRVRYKDLERGGRTSVAGKFFRTNVLIAHARPVQHRMQAFHHLWRSGEIVHRRRGAFEMPRKHGRIDAPCFPIP